MQVENIEDWKDVEAIEFASTIPAESVCELCGKDVKTDRIWYIKGQSRFVTPCDECASKLELVRVNG